MERVLVIGATSGIGRALAGRLAASGCRVGIVGRRAEPLTERDSDPSENPFFQAAADRSPAACRHRLRHWVVFLAVALTAGCGMAL